MLNDRCSLIINMLLKANHPISIDCMAKQFSISQRTVQYTLQKIDDWLIENNLPSLIRKRDKGVQITNQESVQERMVILLNQLGPKVYVFSPNERKFVIQQMLFNTSSTVTLTEMALKLDVSKTTVFHDVAEIKKRLFTQNVYITNNNTNKGLYLKGRERDIRLAYASLLWQVYSYYATPSQKKIISSHIVKTICEWSKEKLPVEILSEVNNDEIIRCLVELQKEWGVLFTDNSFAKLCINIAVSIERLKKGFAVEFNKQDIESIDKKYEHLMAEALVKKLEDATSLNFSEHEIMLIAVYILATNVQFLTNNKIKESFKNTDVSTEALRLSGEIVAETEKYLGIDFKQDKDLIYGLALHIQSLLYRLKYNLPEEKNPILDDFILCYPDIFQVSKCVVETVLNKIHIHSISINDDEICYIAMHLGAALYKLVQKGKQEKKIKILLVCGVGLGTAKLLTIRLINEFSNIEIVGVEPYYNIKQNTSRYQSDFIVSTVPLDDLEIEYLLINPLLKHEDIQKLRQYINNNANYNNLGIIINNVLDEVSNTMILNEEQKILIVLNILKKIELRKAPQRLRLLRLHNFLKISNIRLNVSVKNWRDAINVAGQPLVEAGCISRNYIEATIRNKEKLGAYIAIDKGVAFPHAAPKEGVYKTCFSLITLSNPVCFGNTDTDPIDIVILMATTNTWIHIEALSDIVALLNNEESMSSIRSARHPEEVFEIVQNIRRET